MPNSLTPCTASEINSYVAADNLLNQINPQIGAYGQRGQILSESGLHRVLVGPFASLEQAQSAAAPQVIPHPTRLVYKTSFFRSTR